MAGYEFDYTTAQLILRPELIQRFRLDRDNGLEGLFELLEKLKAEGVQLVGEPMDERISPPTCRDQVRKRTR